MSRLKRRYFIIEHSWWRQVEKKTKAEADVSGKRKKKGESRSDIDERGKKKTWLFYLFTVTCTINWYYYSQRPNMEEKKNIFYKAVDRENNCGILKRIGGEDNGPKSEEIKEA